MRVEAFVAQLQRPGDRDSGHVDPSLRLLLVQHLIGRAILEFHPIDRIGAPPASMINLVFVTLMIIGLALSLWRRR